MSEFSSYNSQYLAKKVSKIEQEIIQLKTKQNYIISDVAMYRSGPLHLTAWAVPSYMESWAGWYSVSAIINFEGILPKKVCFGLADQQSIGGQSVRVYTDYISGGGAPNKLQIMLQIIGYGQFESNIYFWANTPGVIKLVEQFQFETDEW